MSAHRGVIWWSIWPAMVLKTLKNLSQNGKSIRSMWWWERYFRTALLAALLDMWHLNSVSSWEGVRESEYEAGCRLHMYRASRACIVSCYVRCLVAEESPEMQYFWKAPAEGQERSSSAQSCTWAFGSDIFRQGVFVISNETLGRHYVVKFHDPNNHPSSSFIILHHRWLSFILDPLFYFLLALRNPAYGVWPKCLWLQRELHSFLERLPPTADAKELHEGHSPEWQWTAIFFSAMISSQMTSLTSIWKRRHNAQIKSRSNKFQMTRRINLSTNSHIKTFEAWPISCHVSTCLA